jgi:hypothetical protein
MNKTKEWEEEKRKKEERNDKDRQIHKGRK